MCDDADDGRDSWRNADMSQILEGEDRALEDDVDESCLILENASACDWM